MKLYREMEILEVTSQEIKLRIHRDDLNHTDISISFGAFWMNLTTKRNVSSAKEKFREITISDLRR